LQTNCRAEGGKKVRIIRVRKEKDREKAGGGEKIGGP